MVWNESTRGEVRTVLEKIPSLSWEPVADLFCPQARFDAGTDTENYSFVPDPDDREFLALAEAVDAVLVSQDDDLLGHRERAAVLVLTSAEFLGRFS
jgi:predicted nucleic acid-binding protein